MASDTARQQDDEIDLFKLIQTLWAGKWQIAGAALLSMAVMFLYNRSKSAEFTATTAISPISPIEADMYAISNSAGLVQITPAMLMERYLNVLADGDVFENALRELEFIEDSDQFDQEEINLAVTDLVNQISFTAESDGLDEGTSVIEERWLIKFEHQNEDKWREVLWYALSNANELVRQGLLQSFDSITSAQASEAQFALEDIDTAISNAQSDFDKEMREFEVRQAFELEDIDTAIANAMTDYERSTSDRLSFLREQAEIARQLGVAKNTIEAQTFSAQNGMVAAIETNAPFYLRGYEAIDKEIELIEAREEASPFVAGLLELEQNKRALEQDLTLVRADLNKQFLDTVIQLEISKRALEQDLTLKRAQDLFDQTPISSTSEFVAVSYDPNATVFEYNNQSTLRLALAFILGTFLSSIYVLSTSYLRERNSS